MDIIKYFIVLFLVFGAVVGAVFGIFYILLLSKTKKGKQFRHELFKLVEMGRRND